MKKQRKILRKGSWLLFIVSLFIGVSCEMNKQWDEHYKTETEHSVNDSSLLYMLSGLSEYSSFYNAILETGLDSLLNTEFPKTVFAPPNSVFDTVKTKFDTDSLKIFLQFHVTFGSYLTTDLTDVRMRMANDKYINIKNENATIVLDDLAELSSETRNIICTNGVIHGIDRTLILRLNLYEYLYLNFPMFKDYFDSQTSKNVDYDLSIPTGEFDELGRSILDTVFTEYNYFLEEVVDLTAPDVEYTVIIPPGSVVESKIDEEVTKYFGNRDSIPENVRNSIIDDIFGRSIFIGNYSSESIPSELLSVYNKFIPIDKGSFTESDVILNNGRLHVTSNLELNKSSYLLTSYINIYEGMRDQDLNYSVSDESYRLRLVDGQSMFMYYSEQPGDWIEFESEKLLISDYSVYFSPGSAYRSTILQLSIDGEEFGDPFDYQSIGTGEGHIGDITFSSLDKHIVRITVHDYGEDADDNTMRLRSVKFVPHQ